MFNVAIDSPRLMFVGVFLESVHTYSTRQEEVKGKKMG